MKRLLVVTCLALGIVACGDEAPEPPEPVSEQTCCCRVTSSSYAIRNKNQCEQCVSPTACS